MKPNGERGRRVAVWLSLAYLVLVVCLGVGCQERESSSPPASSPPPSSVPTPLSG
jgi:hypothetical protein